jgi:hypothetical protein
MILGLPAESFWLLIGIPAIFLVIMLFDCWRILTRRKD